jgi:predicted CoA-binding protein
MNEPELILRLLRSKAIAIVGISSNPEKPSHYVAAYLQKLGHRLLLVNPALEVVLGEPCYPTLAALPVRPDLVDVFRLPRFLPEIVDEMIELSLPAIWVQAGIVQVEAAAKAEANGIQVVMDRCLMVESRRAGIDWI